jgi:hypothetical protein
MSINPKLREATLDNARASTPTIHTLASPHFIRVDITNVGRPHGGRSQDPRHHVLQKRLFDKVAATSATNNG